MFAPGVFLSLPLHIGPTLFPVSDGSKTQRTGGSVFSVVGPVRGRREPVEDDRLACEVIREGPRGQDAVRRAKIFRKSEAMGVVLNQLRRKAIAVGALNLLTPWVGLQKNTHRHFQVLPAQDRGPGDVYQDVRLLEDAAEVLFRKAEDAAATHFGLAIRPMVFHSAPRHSSGDEIGGVILAVGTLDFVRPLIAVVNVKNLVE